MNIKYTSIISLVAVCALISLPALTMAAKAGRTESTATTTLHSVKKALPDTWTTNSGKAANNTSNLPSLQLQTTVQPTVTTQATLGTNLIANPSVETAGTSSSTPASWNRGGYGTNTRVLTYPASPAQDGTRAISVQITSYTSGDAKWYFTDVPITPGKTYQFSDYSMSDVPSIIDARFNSSGTFSYKDFQHVPASASYQNNTFQFVAPAGVTSITFFHLINSVGTLTVDNFSLQEVQTTPPPPPSGNNLISNGNFETAGTNGLPAGWNKGGYGTNTRTLTYPVTGASGSGAQVQITAYTSGDAKWWFTPVAVTAGSQYTYSDNYRSDISSILTAQFTMSAGGFSYKDLGTLPASSGFAPSSVGFTAPAGATAVTIFHLIKGVGTLTIDDASLIPASSGGGGNIFTTGAVTFRLDDNTEDQYTTAAPILDNAGFKATFYVVSQQIADNDFSGYMFKSQIQDLAARGFEIGGHTRTHPHLTTLTQQQQTDEISGGRQDLLGWNVGPVLTFAYPFGEYDSTTIQIVKDAGFTSAGATIESWVTPSSDPYQLEHQECHNDTSLATIESWVDTAAANHQWLIMTFHNINTDTSDLYACSPSKFQSIVNYVKTKGIPVITVTQGRAALP